MAGERKYRDDEVSEIFALAATGDSRKPPALADPGGLTLAELQEVGREVGLAPEQVAQAAASIDTRSETLPSRTSLGSRVSVGRVVQLPRAATDREWEILVTELRATFGARGRVASHGDTREWTNGNLHAFIEPTEAGYRLRLGTRKGNAPVMTALGAAGLIIGLFLLVTRGLDEATFGAVREILIPAVMALMGGGVMAGNVLSLRRWASEREEQMEHIAGRARALLELPSSERDPAR